MEAGTGRDGCAGSSGGVERAGADGSRAIMVAKLGPAAIGAVALGNAISYTPSLFRIWMGAALFRQESSCS